MEYYSKCVLCNTKLMAEQKVVLSNKSCIFYQIPQDILVGSGIIVPKKHKRNVFELTDEEIKDTFDLLKDVKEYLDDLHNPDGYNICWNTDSAAGQHMFHAHLHVIPRFKNEPLAGKDLLSFIRVEENKR